MMRIRISIVATILFAISFQGYPVVASLTTLIGADNTAFSLSMRISIVIISALFLMQFKLSAPTKLADTVFWATMIFWLLYFCRLLEITALRSHELPKGAFYYWMWGFGSCFIPFFAIASALGSTFQKCVCTKLLIVVLLFYLLF